MAAQEVARAERAKSVSDGLKVREEWLRPGGTVVPWPEDARLQLAKAAEPVYERFVPEFGSNRVLK